MPSSDLNTSANNSPVPISIPSIEQAASQDSLTIIQSLSSDEKSGLTATAAAERRLQLASNIDNQPKSPNAFALFIDQYRSTVVIVLLIATAASVIAREYLQAIGIGIAVVINSLVGFLTEYRSQVSLAELEKLSGPLAHVRRDGVDKNIPVNELVPGDILLLNEGDRVPADVRLITSTNLTVDESALTGESVPVYKASEADEDSPTSTILYQGSVVSAGKTKAIVIATGFDTKLGKLGRTLTTLMVHNTPLQEELEQLGKQLSVVIVAICAVLFFIGLAKGENSWQMLQTAIALAIAAIPEGLPVIATLTLAEGTRQMIKLGALTRRLSAVETLGCTEIVCTDKTGTLTTNELTVSDILAGNRHFRVSSSGQLTSGSFFDESGNEIATAQVPKLQDVLLAATLCNDAKLEAHDSHDWHVHGDPTEGALLVVALKAGIEKSATRNTHPRTTEFSFDLKRKRMTTLHNEGANLIAYSKGAPESVIRTCSQFASENGTQALDDKTRAWLIEQNNALAKKGLRVLAFARKEIASDTQMDQNSVENDMTFLGLVGMSDQPKKGVDTAVSQCHRAGIKVIMVTGDQPETACAIAKQIGIVASDRNAADAVLNGSTGYTDWHDDARRLENITVLARIEPEGKFRIVKALQAAGKVVAMTGDGVNDAAALKQADIGIAMGQGGTSLAREASDMVLTDDNFNVVVHAIEQGRTIYANIRSAIAYLLTASLASVFTVAGASMLNMPMPLTPLQLLWLNLIMHIFPGLGLALQKSYPGIMDEKPRGRNQSLLDRKSWMQIIGRGAIVAIASLIAINLAQHETPAAVMEQQTVALATMSLALLMQSWSWLATKPSVKMSTLLSNAPMQISTLLGLLMLLAGTSLTPVQEILNTTTMSMPDWTLVVSSSLCTFLITTIASRLFVTIRR